MRNRAGTSNINRRKMVRNVTVKDKPVSVSTKTTNVTSQPSQPTQRIVQGSNTVAPQGIAVAGPRAYSQGGSPRSSNIIGGEIKTDEQGRMSLEEIEKLNILEQLGRGAVVPTEQMVGMVKDVAYGVKSEDQRTMESGLDLLLNPLIKPFADPSMRSSGVITDKWYYPEELKSDWKVLPEFMQKGVGTPEKRTLVEGLQANIGNTSAIIQSEQSGKIRDAEFGVSAERFSRAPGYYIGSALGEIPYFIVGAGQIKAVATISAKATAGVIRGSVKGSAGAKLIATAYKVERTVDKLQKAVSVADKGITTLQITNPKVVTSAVKVLKKGYSDNVDVVRKNIKNLSPEEASMAKITSDNAIKNSAELGNKFTPARMNKLKRMPEGTEAEITLKINKVEQFNREVRTILLPNVKKFKNEFLAETVKQSRNTRTERIASAISGSPTDVATTINKYFNRVGSTKGDNASGIDVTIQNIRRDTIDLNMDQGKYSGVLGNIKLNKDLYGGVVTSALGIDRATRKGQNIAELVSRTMLTNRVLDGKNVAIMKGRMDENISILKDENKLFEAAKKSDVPDQKINTVDRKAMDQKIFNNELEIAALEKAKVSSFERLDFNMGPIQKKGKGTTRYDGWSAEGQNLDKAQTTQWRFSYSGLAKTHEGLADSFDQLSLNVAVRPSVNVRKEYGIWRGTIGDDIYGVGDFFITESTRKESIGTFGEKFVSPSSKAKRVGLKTFKVPFSGGKKVRTLLPAKVDQKELIFTLYQNRDALRISGGGKSGTTPLIMVNKAINPDDLRLIQNSGFLGEFTGYKGLEDMIGGGKYGNKLILEENKIPMKTLKSVIDNNKNPWKLGDSDPFKNVSIDTKSSATGDAFYKPEVWRYAGDVLMQRAVLESRPAEVLAYAKDKIIKIEGRKGFIQDQLETKIQTIRSSNAKKYLGVKGDVERATDIKQLRRKIGDEMLTLENSQISLEKYKDIDDVKRISKEINVNESGVPRGTAVSTPLYNLEQYDLKMQTMDRSGIEIRDMKNPSDTYFKSDKKMYKVLDRSFNPEMITTADQVRQSRSFLTTTDNGKQFSTQIIDTKTQNFMLDGTETGTPKSFNLIPSTTKSGKTTFKKEDVVPKIDDVVEDSMINLDKPLTYAKYLKELTEDEVGKLEYGSLWGIVKKQQSTLKGIDQTSPSQIKQTFNDADEIILAKKNLKEQITEGTKITAAKFVGNKVFSLVGTKNSLSDRFTGKRWRPVDNRTLKPDDSTLKDQSIQFFDNMGQGQGVRNTGFTDLARMINADPKKGITQGKNIGGFQFNTMYELLDTHYLRKERDMSIYDVQSKSQLKTEKRTNYKVLEENARQKGNLGPDYDDTNTAMIQFKKQMVNLVRTKVQFGKEELGWKSKEMKSIIGSPEKYRAAVTDIVDTPDNLYIRAPTKMERIKNKGKGKSSKWNFINPRFDLPALAPKRESRVSAFKKLGNQWGSQLIGVSSDIGGDPGMSRAATSPAFMPGKINQFARSVGVKLGIEPVSAEQVNPNVSRAITKTYMSYSDIYDSLPRHHKKQFDKSVPRGFEATDETNIRREAFERSEKTAAEEKVSDIVRRIEQLNNQKNQEKIDVKADRTMTQAEKTETIAKISKAQKSGIKTLQKQMKPSSRQPVVNNLSVNEDGSLSWKLVDQYEGGVKGNKFYYSQNYPGVGDLRLNPAPKTNKKGYQDIPSNTMTPDETDLMVKGMIDASLGKTYTSKSSDPVRAGLNKNILKLFDTAFTKEQKRTATKSPASMSKWLESDPDVKPFTQTQEFKSLVGQQQQLGASIKNISDSKMKQQSKSPGNRVQAFDADVMAQNYLRANPQTVGIKQQVNQSSGLARVSLAMSGGSVSQSETDYAIPSLMAGPQSSFGPPQRNALDQAIGDIQTTINGINTGSTNISEKGESQEVKSYILPKGMEASMSTGLSQGGLANLSTITSSLSSSSLSTLPISRQLGGQGSSLVEGLNLGVFSAEKSKIDTAALLKKSVISQGINIKSGLDQGQMKGFAFTTPVARPVVTDQVLIPPNVLAPPVVPTRVLPITPLVPPYLDPQNDWRDRNLKLRKKKSKKTWWQTPANWYEPYYWGGKNQEGAGYVTFTGKEPGKVKKYEKRHFGIGVNDSPFGIKGKWF